MTLDEANRCSPQTREREMSRIRVVVSGYTSVDTRLVTSLPRRRDGAPRRTGAATAPLGRVRSNTALGWRGSAFTPPLVAWLGDDERTSLPSVLEDAA